MPSTWNYIMPGGKSILKWLSYAKVKFQYKSKTKDNKVWLPYGNSICIILKFLIEKEQSKRGLDETLPMIGGKI
jgi:hypothetical protein